MLTDQQIQQICEEVSHNPYVRGILLTGSYAHGKPHASSDLDLRMVTVMTVNWCDNDTWHFGTRIDAFYNPPDVIHSAFAHCLQTGIETTVHAWAHGKIMYDPEGIVGALQRQAQQTWVRGPNHGRWKRGSHKVSARLLGQVRALKRRL